MVNRVVSLKTTAKNWSLKVSPEMGPDCQAYISAVATNIEDDQRRSRRQWLKFRAQEDETLLDDLGRPPAFPDDDRAVPPVPVGLAAHRPCLWLTAPCVVSTPKREPDENSDFSDVASDIPEPKRRPSEVQYGGQYGSAPGPPLGRRYSLDIITIRGYPPSSVLNGMETDSSFLPHPVFTARHEAGRDLSRPFNRGEQDPAILAIESKVKRGRAIAGPVK